MAFVETNPEKLRKLTEEAKSKEDKDLGFYPSAVHAADHWVAKFFSPKDRYHSDKGYPYTYKPAGNFLARPILNTDLHLGTTWGTNLRPFRPKFCQIMERDYLRCLGRVGVQNSDKICRLYWEDLQECQSHDKSIKRILYMEKVRKQKNLPPMDPPPYSSIPRYF
uniref:NADH:ubiquinone oxidoreductase, NDUFS5-15kDa n=1 Tax=Schistocephalus solidus TaxID=70667 RepID=A0A0X3NYM7_SCHSO